MYFDRYVKPGAFGKFMHSREVADVDKQDVIRMNRDTIYSFGIFDLDAASVTVTLPDTAKRFMSMQVINQDHYTIAVEYAPGKFSYNKDKVGTRYVIILIRTLVNPEDQNDINQVHALQDSIKFEYNGTGTWEIPNWDSAARDKVRSTLETLASFGVDNSKPRFGTKKEVDPISHLLGTATGWGGNPDYAAVYNVEFPKNNDGKTAYALKVKDVPVDGFWSISVYNSKGFFEKNDKNAYSVNNITADKDSDGAVTVHFGGDPGSSNYLFISPGWNYVVRLYRARKEILDGSWKFPEAVEVK
jgi:hypothetical protein